MPVLRNRLVLRIARGLKGFVNFEAGLTRGAVPNVESLEAQIRELGQARKRLKERDRQLSTLKAQLARRDKKIEELNRRSRGRLAGKDVGVQKEARLKIARIRSRLYALGFVDRAVEDLQNLVADSSRPALRRLAAWELALWHANQYNEEGARRCLELLPVALQGEKDPARLRRTAVIEAECQQVLGDIEAAKRTVSQALTREPHADLFLAMANLEDSAPTRIDWVNKALQLHGIPRILYDASAEGPLYDSLKSGQDRRARVEVSSDTKVSVIVPVYNGEAVIQTALDSVLSQTWTNLEVLVVDDCSTDATVPLVEDYVRRDSRVRLIRAEANRGTYVARNLALREATGEFVTCHDADDWSHPEKIECQARHLLNNPSAIGNTSQQARATADLRFYRRGNPGFYVDNNTSSFMFRREPVMKALGYWDCVRFAADSEFIGRVRRAFGNERVVSVPTGPLSLLRQSSSSLTGNVAFGIHTRLLVGVRKEHFEAYTHFHDTAEVLRCEFPQDDRPFAVPEPMWPTRETKKAERRHFDVILASDFRLLGGSTLSNVEEIKAQKRMGLRTGLIQMSRYDLEPNRTINPKVRELLDGDRVQMLVYGEKVFCDTLIVRYPPILQEWQQFVPDVEAANVHVIINQTPMRDYSDKGEPAYEIGRCEEHLQKYFGKAGVWHPIGPLARSALYEHHAEELAEITLANEDWSNIIDVDEWWRGSRPPRGPRPRIGRHSRGHYLKWPMDPGELLAAYPDSGDYEVHILGGAEAPRKVLGGLPENWHVLEFGAVYPRDFLSALDVFVYYTHPGLVEAFGRTIIEAMAVGVPVILPHSYREVFREAAIYAEPLEVKRNVDRLMSDDDYYESQVRIARDYVEKHFGYAKHATRLRERIKKQAVPAGANKSAIVGREAVSSERLRTAPRRGNPLEKLTEVVLERYDLQGARLDFLKKGRKRWLLRVSLPSGGDFLLRIYQPPHIEQKPLLHFERTLRSQLFWQEALRRDMGISVPEPVPAVDGQLTSRISVEGLPRPQICTLLRWMPGKSKAASEMSPADVSMAGSYVAWLHRHSEWYSVPEDFIRSRWDWDHLFGEAKPLWREGRKFYSESEMTLFRNMAEHIRRDLRVLGESSDVFGIIHRDLNPGNLVFHEGNVSAIDFDCCGWGYYLYDLALPLLSLEKSYGNRCGPLQDALLEGYQRVRPLPKNYMEYLDTFIVMRTVARVNRSLSMGTPIQASLPPDYMEKLRDFTSGLRRFR